MKIAIDIILLLPEEVKNLCISINKKAKADAPLGKDDFVPHISLCIGVVSEENYHDLLRILDEIDPTPLDIEINQTLKADDTISSDMFEVQKSDELQKLHEEIMDKVKHVLEFTTNHINVFFRKENEILEYIPKTLQKGFLNFAYGNFKPHISLRCKNSVWKKYPIKFIARNLALFHVGRNITCRKILWKRELHNKP